MQACGRFIEHIKRLATLWTLQFGGELDTLRLTA